MQTLMLIGSQAEAGEGEKFAVVNPRTGKPIAELAEASIGQINKAVQSASSGFQRWSRTTPVARSAALLAIAAAVERNADEFAGLEALDCGKPKHLVLRDEIPAIVDCFRYFASAVRCMTGAVAGE